MRRPRLAGISRLALTFLPWVLAAGAATLVVVLQLRHEDLAERYRALRQQSIAAYRGLTLPSFEGVPAGGDSAIAVAAMPEGDRQVLFLVRASCPYCKATIPTWRTLSSALDSASRASDATAGDGPHVRVLALSLDSLPDSTAALFVEHGLSVPVISLPSARLRRLYRGAMVPQTLVVDAEGRVLFARAGVFRSAAEVDSVLRAATTPRPAAPLPSPTVAAR